MEELLSMTNSANTTLITVEHTFVKSLIVVETAYHAKVLREVLVALDASFGLGLLRVAPETLYMGHFVPVQLMILFRVHLVFEMNLIVTESTGEERSFADRVRALQLTGTEVVATAVVTWFEINVCVFIIRDLLLFTFATLSTLLSAIVWPRHIFPVNVIIDLVSSCGLQLLWLLGTLRFFGLLLVLFLLLVIFHDFLFCGLPDKFLVHKRGRKDYYCDTESNLLERGRILVAIPH